MDEAQIKPKAFILDGLSNAELMTQLAMARASEERSREIQNTLIEEARRSGEYQAAQLLRECSQQYIAELTDAIKSRAVNAFDGQNKKPWAGVSIQEKTVSTCTDPEAAVGYVFEQARDLLSVDFSALAKLAVKLNGTPHALPFYTIRKEPTAVIASDLSAYINPPRPDPATDEPPPF